MCCVRVCGVALVAHTRAHQDIRDSAGRAGVGCARRAAGAAGEFGCCCAIRICWTGTTVQPRPRCFTNVAVASAVVRSFRARVVVRTLVAGYRNDACGTGQSNESTVSGVPSLAFDRYRCTTGHINSWKDLVRVTFVQPHRCRRGGTRIWGTHVHGPERTWFSRVPCVTATYASVDGSRTRIRGIVLGVFHFRTRSAARVRRRVRRVRVEAVLARPECAAIGVRRCTYLTGGNRGNCAHVIASKRYPEVGGRVNEVSLRRCHTILLGFVGFSAARDVVRYAASLRYARCDHRDLVSHLRAGENFNNERQAVDLGERAERGRNATGCQQLKLCVRT